MATPIATAMGLTHGPAAAIATEATIPAVQKTFSNAGASYVGREAPKAALPSALQKIIDLALQRGAVENRTKLGLGPQQQ